MKRAEDDSDDDQLPADTGDNLQAISCGDSIDAGNATIQNTFDEILFVTRNVSPLFGPSFSSQGCVYPPLVRRSTCSYDCCSTNCYAWPVRAVERYSGPWNNKLSNPILVIGNQVRLEPSSCLFVNLTSSRPIRLRPSRTRSR